MGDVHNAEPGPRSIRLPFLVSHAPVCEFCRLYDEAEPGKGLSYIREIRSMELKGLVRSGPLCFGTLDI